MLYVRYDSMLSSDERKKIEKSLFIFGKNFVCSNQVIPENLSLELFFSVPTAFVFCSADRLRAEELAQAGDDKWVDSWLGFLTKNPSSTKDAIKLLRDAFGIASSSQVQSSRPTAAHVHGVPSEAANGDLQPDGANGPQQHDQNDQTDPIARAFKVVSAAPEEVVDDEQEHCGDCGGEGF